MPAGSSRRASAIENRQSMPSTLAPVAIKSSQLPCVPSEKTMIGGAPVSDPARWSSHLDASSEQAEA